MIGQEKLLNVINSYSLENFPRSILFIGERGCGKHTIIGMIADKFKLSVEDLSRPIKDDYKSEAEFKTARDNWLNNLQNKFTEISYCCLKKIYVLNLHSFSDIKEQNKFLKFIEEPNKNSYIILLAETESEVLPTVLNRCVKFRFETYSIEQLKEIRSFANEEIYNIFRTPGQLVDVNYKNFDNLYALCNLLTERLSSNSFGNTLTIETKINFDEEFNKFDFDTFLNTLQYVSYKNYIKNRSEQSLNIYLTLCNFRQELIGKFIIKENFIISLLNKLWECVRKWN